MHAGVPYLEVTNIRVEEQGALRTPEYYCEVCTITVRYPQVCPCCQGEMELRFDPMP
jgi:rubrerythrin